MQSASLNTVFSAMRYSVHPIDSGTIGNYYIVLVSMWKQRDRERCSMTEFIRVPPQEVRQKVESGSALLVCAYDDEQKFNQNHLEGAISLSEFKSRLASLPQDQEIIFYCAWPKEASAVGQAETHTKAGHRNITVLGGGVEAWKKAGYMLES